ncbi:acyl-CoA dehydrogenase family protein [Actinomadura hibisca]|uniref:acyl-CoA dehydrogenase family protein n=1 Tax=Actinomadura hibisca TaxID=68565 RepID=UPI00082FB29F|nr:acyl-CoA dehydrogenase family protein [Actinomadura hibisca]
MTERPRWMDDETEALQRLAHDFFAKEVAPHEPRYARQQHVDREVWTEAGKLGLLCASIPEEYGGGGGTLAHEAAIGFGQLHALATSFGGPVHSGIIAHYINAYGTEEQKRTWLPRMATGEVVSAIAMTEPGTGSDLQSVRTTAIRDGDEYVINGAKTFITNGLLCDLVVVVAKTDPDGQAKGISLFLVETDRPGFARGRNLEKVGQHGQDTCELFFQDVRVPAGHLLGAAEGQGFVQLMEQLPQERLVLAVGAVAQMEKALELTLAYAKEREAFGRPLTAFQNTRFELAEVATIVTVARAFADDCIVRAMAGRLDIVGAAKAKWWLTEQQCVVVDKCAQLFGGYGYMAEYPIARLWADARVQKVYGGTNEIMKEIIGRSL